MDVIYQCTIIIDLTLLAILVAIYLFASSLYKGAATVTTQEEEKAINRRKDVIIEEKQKLLNSIAGINEDDYTGEITNAINRFNNAISTADKDIEKVRGKNNALTIKWLVIIPGIFILTSIAAAGTAIALSILIIWVASIVLMLAGVYFIGKNLFNIEYFSKVIDVGVLMERALDRHADKQRPVVVLELWHKWLEEELTMKCGEEKEIEFDISLKQGVRGKNAQVRFSCSEEFDFPGETVEKDDMDFRGMKKPKRFWTTTTDLNPKEYSKNSFILKAPETPGKYIMAYWVKCEEYTGDEVFFNVNVV